MSDAEKVPLPFGWRTSFDRETFTMLRDMDKRTKALCQFLRDWWKTEHQDDNPDGEEVAPTMEGAAAEIRASRSGKNRLVAVDRAIAAIHVVCAESTFETIPHAMLHLLQGQIPVFLEKTVAKIAAMKLVGKTTLLGAITDMFSGVFGIPAQRQLRRSIEAEIFEKSHQAMVPFLVDKPRTFGFLSSQAALMRHPRSSGEPILGLDGKVRGRKRTIRCVQTRHWTRPKTRANKRADQ